MFYLKLLTNHTLGNEFGNIAFRSTPPILALKVFAQFGASRVHRESRAVSFTQYMLAEVRVSRHYMFSIIKEKLIVPYLSFVYMLSILKLTPNFMESFILPLALFHLLDQKRGSY